MAENKNIDDETRERALAFVEANNKKEPRAVAVEDDATMRLPKNKPRVVSKKELEDSGLSLRDFLNKERGLVRREDKADKVEAAKKQLRLGEKPTSKEVESAKKQLGLAKGGMVKANCGASVPPSQKAKK
jgi:hypothetical protein